MAHWHRGSDDLYLLRKMVDALDRHQLDYTSISTRFINESLRMLTEDIGLFQADEQCDRSS